MTNDLGYSKENLSLVKVICTPVNIFFAGISGYVSNKDPFTYMYYLMFAITLVSTYAVLVLLGTMPADHESQNTLGVYTHVFTVSFLLDMLDELQGTITFAILLARTDKRVSAMHVTVFAALNNFTSFIHKTYLFWLVEEFGIYYPQIAITVVTIAWFCLYKKAFLGLSKVPKNGWYIDDQTLK